jgi:spermidine synthase
LLLSGRTYDVIISEPSNPWMAGVAALFTREFFTAARRRLSPGGVICQWAHTYDISERDLQSIIGTFLSVFPSGTAWLVGEADLLLIASTHPLDTQLQNLGREWGRPGVAADLRERAVLEPFALWSLFVGGPEELQRYAEGTTLQTDDRMMLEFSGPRAIYGAGSRDNAVKLRQLLDHAETPAAIRRARETAGVAQWRDRGTMMLKVEDFESAYQDFARALAQSPDDGTVLDGFVRSAVATHREADALERLKASIAAHPNSTTSRVASSKLLAAGGSFDAAIEAATDAWKISPRESSALEQVASIYSDLGDVERLDQVLGTLRQMRPAAPRLPYYEASSRFLHGQLPDALGLAQRAVEQTPADAAAQNLLGAIYASAGRTAEARAAFEAALRLNPLDAATYTNLGLLELEASNRSGAARYFAEALSVDPESKAAMEGLARAR